MKVGSALTALALVLLSVLITLLGKQIIKHQEADGGAAGKEEPAKPLLTPPVSAVANGYGISGSLKYASNVENRLQLKPHPNQRTKAVAETGAEVQVEGENHHILTHDKRVMWSRTILAWFDRWLKDEPQWWNDLYPGSDGQ